MAQLRLLQSALSAPGPEGTTMQSTGVHSLRLSKDNAAQAKARRSHQLCPTSQPARARAPLAPQPTRRPAPLTLCRHAAGPGPAPAAAPPPPAPAPQLQPPALHNARRRRARPLARTREPPIGARPRAAAAAFPRLAEPRGTMAPSDPRALRDWPRR